MELYTGTSGFAYKEWKGSFYPEKIKNADMLPFYASHFKACEINNTFYRMPAEKTLLEWREQVPPEFRFILKASQQITHFKRLKEEAREPLQYFAEKAGVLGEQLGPVLIQLPPNMKCDVGRLEAFLDFMPVNLKPAFEFRHASWFDDVVFDVLRAKQACLCVADTDDESTPRVATVSDWGYLRLRRVEYASEDLASYAAWVREQSWKEVFVFFKHEDAGTGPRLAKQFAEIMKL
ncbi:MAG TPA: DUF72 domain-containing protein [Longimicrobiales bacterium]|nr:DUF72 domain-containing protein [Longimicrobiales bacterium]